MKVYSPRSCPPQREPTEMTVATSIFPESDVPFANRSCDGREDVEEKNPSSPVFEYERRHCLRIHHCPPIDEVMLNQTVQTLQEGHSEISDQSNMDTPAVTLDEPTLLVTPSRTTGSDDIQNVRQRDSRSVSFPPYGQQVKQILLSDIKHHQIAKQLTFMMAAIYQNIDFTSTSKPKCDQNAEGEVGGDEADERGSRCYFTDKYVEIFNQTVKWMQFSILGAASCKERARIIKKWIKTCHFLWEFRNFHGLVAVHCALKSTVVHKLKKAWSAYPRILKKKHHRLLERVSHLVSYRENYKALRREMDQRGSHSFPTLPYIGIYRKDLLFAKEMKNGRDMLIEMEAKYIGFKERGDYGSLHEDKLLQVWLHYQLKNTAIFSERDMMRMSNQISSRDGPRKRRRRRTAPSATAASAPSMKGDRV